MIGIIDVGGGLRDAYGAGVLDYCLEHDIQFDYALGVSAGGGNLATYVSKQIKRNYPFYLELPFRDEYMSLKNLIEKGSYLDLQYIYNELSKEDGEYPIDYDTFINNPIDYYITAYNVQTGQAHYFTKEDISRNHYDVFCASSCLPLVCQPIDINGQQYYDGGLANPIPIDKAIKDGCDKIVLVLTRPKNYFRKQKDDIVRARLLKPFNKLASENLLKRAQRYNESLKYALELEKQGKVLIIAPDTIGELTTLTKDKQVLYMLYRKGYVDAEKIKEFIKED